MELSFVNKDRLLKGFILMEPYQLLEVKSYNYFMLVEYMSKEVTKELYLSWQEQLLEQ